MRWVSALPSGVIRKRAKRRVRQREKRHHDNGGIRVWSFAKIRFFAGQVRLYAPSSICLTRWVERQATLAFCKRIRQSYLQEGRSVILDFSRARTIEASGMLVVVAEVDRSQRMGTASQRFTCKLPDETCERTKIVRQVIDQIELLERTGHTSIHSDKSDFHSSVRDWRYATGTRVDEEPGDILEKHQGRIAPALMTKMQIGLAEAITNSIHHAYKAHRSDGCNRYKEHRWWMFTHEADGMLQVLVCDLGIGISRSLPLKWSKDLLRKLGAIFERKPEDVASIRMALELGKTSTEEQNRGKGLPQIWNALHDSNVGGVAILSGRGHVNYSADTGCEHDGAYNSLLLGTLISWKVAVDDPMSVTDGATSD